MNKTATTMEDKLNDFLDLEDTISDSKKIVKAKKQEIEYYDQEIERDKEKEERQKLCKINLALLTTLSSG